MQTLLSHGVCSILRRVAKGVNDGMRGVGKGGKYGRGGRGDGDGDRILTLPKRFGGGGISGGGDGGGGDGCGDGGGGSGGGGDGGGIGLLVIVISCWSAFSERPLLDCGGNNLVINVENVNDVAFVGNGGGGGDIIVGNSGVLTNW